MSTYLVLWTFHVKTQSVEAPAPHSPALETETGDLSCNSVVSSKDQTIPLQPRAAAAQDSLALGSGVLQVPRAPGITARAACSGSLSGTQRMLGINH